MECGNVLPSLTFLDASGTDINQDLLDSLEYQPNLQKILAIGIQIIEVLTLFHTFAFQTPISRTLILPKF